VVAAAVAAVLGATANGYGYHRDELYFRMLAAHPAWGYVDEPPMTPMLVRASTALFGDSLWALRVPAIVFAAATVMLVALLCRELGGGRFAQVLAAFGGAGAFPLIAGHVFLTATPDLVVWVLVVLFACRALLRAEPRWWLATGLTVGVGLYNKQLIVLLLIGLVVGLALAGPSRSLTSPWLWAGAGIAVLIAVPTLIYQATNGWPELHMAHAISVDKGGDDRVTYVPFQLILLGPPLVPSGSPGSSGCSGTRAGAPSARWAGRTSRYRSSCSRAAATVATDVPALLHPARGRMYGRRRCCTRAYSESLPWRASGSQRGLADRNRGRRIGLAAVRDGGDPIHPAGAARPALRHRVPVPGPAPRDGRHAAGTATHPAPTGQQDRQLRSRVGTHHGWPRPASSSRKPRMISGSIAKTVSMTWLTQGCSGRS
jgi:hypothetical protein